MGEVAENGMTVLTSSHNLRELTDVCDWVGIMEHGRMRLEHPLAEMQESFAKVQVAFADDALVLPQGIEVLSREMQGRLYSLAVLTFALPAIGLANCGWWLVLVATFTFVFYATALFCVQLSGSHSCAVWLFLGANFLIVVVELVFRFFASYLVWGLDLGSGVSSMWTSPLLGMGKYGIPGWSFRDISGVSLLASGETSISSIGLSVGWGALGFYAAFGLVCALAALLLSGTRPLEQAGETVPYRFLRVDFVDPFGAYQVGKLGAVEVHLSNDADDSVWAISVPVSRKGTPAVCAWLAENMQQ